MATRVVHTDDIDGTEGANVVHFSLEDEAYEIDLVEANLQRLHEALEPFISAGRKISGGATYAPAGTPVRRRRGRPNRPGGPKLEEVREWARANGHRVGSKGRIPATVQQAYDEAHG